MADSDNTTALLKVSRRSVLTGIAAVAPLATVPTGAVVAIGDPDAELKRAWQAVLDHEAACGHGPEDVPGEWIGRWAELHEAAAELPAFTLAGPSIKVQMLVQELDGDSDRSDAIVKTTLAALDRLAPGSVAYRPQASNEAEGDAA